MFPTDNFKIKKINTKNIEDRDPNLYVRRAEEELKKGQYFAALNEIDKAISFATTNKIQYVWEKLKIYQATRIEAGCKEFVYKHIIDIFKYRSEGDFRTFLTVAHTIGKISLNELTTKLKINKISTMYIYQLYELDINSYIKTKDYEAAFNLVQPLLTNDKTKEAFKLVIRILTNIAKSSPKKLPLQIGEFIKGNIRNLYVHSNLNEFVLIISVAHENANIPLHTLSSLLTNNHIPSIFTNSKYYRRNISNVLLHYANEAEKYVSNKDYFSALELTDFLISYKPTEEYYIQGGNILLHLDKYNQATDYFNKAIKLSDDKVGCYVNLATTCMKHAQSDLAISYFQKALKDLPSELSEQTASLWNFRTIVSYTLGSYAYDCYKRFPDKNYDEVFINEFLWLLSQPLSNDMIFNINQSLGEYYEEIGSFKLAHTHYKNAKKVNPDFKFPNSRGMKRFRLQRNLLKCLAIISFIGVILLALNYSFLGRLLPWCGFDFF